MNAPLTKRYIVAPHIGGKYGACTGCAFWLSGDCTNKFRGELGTGCVNPDKIAIEDTPEGRAAYVAAKLEAANG